MVISSYSNYTAHPNYTAAWHRHWCSSGREKSRFIRLGNSRWECGLCLLAIRTLTLMTSSSSFAGAFKV